MKSLPSSVKVAVPYCYEAEAIMPRGRIPRPVTIQSPSPLVVSVPAITSADAPCAFVLHSSKYKQVGDQYRSFDVAKKILAFDDRLWLPALTPSRSDSDAPMTIAQLQQKLSDGPVPWRTTYAIALNQVRKIVTSSESERVREIQALASQYLLIDDTLFTTCSEPCFAIATFGLGHNHGGTALFAEMEYNSNINRSRYFRADQRAEAIAAAEKIALARGDTQSVPILPIGDIEVFLPACVHRHPELDGPDGDPFLNRIYDITQSMPDPVTAGFGVLAVLADEIAKPSASST